MPAHKGAVRFCLGTVTAELALASIVSIVKFRAVHDWNQKFEPPRLSSQVLGIAAAWPDFQQLREQIQTLHLQSDRADINVWSLAQHRQGAAPLKIGKQPSGNLWSQWRTQDNCRSLRTQQRLGLGTPRHPSSEQEQQQFQRFPP